MDHIRAPRRRRTPLLLKIVYTLFSIYNKLLVMLAIYEYFFFFYKIDLWWKWQRVCILMVFDTYERWVDAGRLHTRVRKVICSTLTIRRALKKIVCVYFYIRQIIFLLLDIFHVVFNIFIIRWWWRICVSHTRLSSWVRRRKIC